MNSHTNTLTHGNLTRNQRTPLTSLAIILALLAALSASGCVGLTSAGTPTANASSNTASSGSLAASATSLTFGNVTAGTSSSQTLTLTNTGAATVTISQATITGASFSVVGGVSSVSIAAGQNRAFQVQFAPQGAGNVNGSMAVASDAANSPLAVSLSGTGMTSLAITTQPVSQGVTAGQTAAFMVAATGTGTLTYQWKKNGTAISGATSSSYTSPATTSSDSGASFTVVVTDNSGSLTSNAATLTVTAAPVAPSVTTQPVSQTVTSGQPATFNVVAAGSGPLTYQWARNGAAIAGATAAAYTTPATATSDSGAVFTVTVANSTGNVTSNAATLTVTAAPVAPSVTTQPASQTVTAGQTATFAVVATGSGPLTYQWARNGAAITGATAASYTTPATAASDNGTSFTVIVAGSTGNVTSNAATLTVTAAPVAPSITTQPGSQAVTAGQTATFSVTATGTVTLTYQWKKNGIAISSATAASYTTPATAASDNGAWFAVTVTNSVGSATSNAATLTVNTPPTITTQPVSQTVTAGQTASFSVTATGTGTLTYQWMKNGTAISGATAAAYTTPATAASDNGASFTVIVAGSTSNVTSNAATLTVNAPPTITTQPVSQTVTAGQTATFSVAATGTATLTYQWKKNGIALSGATAASYTTPATATSDSGAQFTVTITNSAGNVTSNAATLTVNAATFLLNPSMTSLSFGSVTLGGSSILGVTLTNGGNSNVTVSNVTISGAGYTAGGVTTGQIFTPGQTATLNVTFTPAATGSLPGSVTVTSNATNSPGTVSLSGTGTQPVSHSVTLSWTASTSAVSGYNVYRSIVSGGSYSKLNSTLAATTSYTDSTVQAGQTYFYVVTSVNSSGTESSFSTQVSATIPTP